MGIQPGMPRAIIVARTMEQQRRAIQAIKASICPRLFGVDLEHIRATEETFEESGYGKALCEAIARPRAVRRICLKMGNWPEPKNRYWPHTAPMLTEPELFFKTKASGKAFNKGPLVRLIQFGNLEGAVAIIDPISDEAGYQLHPEVLSFLKNPVYVKMLHSPRQDWTAMANSFKGWERPLIKAPHHTGAGPSDTQLKWSTCGWINVQPTVEGKPINLVESLRMHHAQPEFIDHHEAMKKDMAKLFQEPYELVRPLEKFNEIQAPGCQAAGQAEALIHYAAIDCLVPLHIGIQRTLWLCGMDIKNGNNYRYLEHLRGIFNIWFEENNIIPWLKEEHGLNPQTELTQHNIVQSQQRIKEQCGIYWPGRSGANRFSTLEDPMKWPRQEGGSPFPPILTRLGEADQIKFDLLARRWGE